MNQNGFTFWLLHLKEVHESEHKREHTVTADASAANLA